MSNLGMDFDHGVFLETLGWPAKWRAQVNCEHKPKKDSVEVTVFFFNSERAENRRCDYEIITEPFQYSLEDGNSAFDADKLIPVMMDEVKNMIFEDFEE